MAPRARFELATLRLTAGGMQNLPVDFDALRARLAEFLKTRRQERRRESRVKLRVPRKLLGTDANGKPFVVLTMSENIGLSSFLCATNTDMPVDSSVDVRLLGTGDNRVGLARIVRSEWQDTQYPRYACLFTEKTGCWVLQ